jgi:hypothetical protein
MSTLNEMIYSVREMLNAYSDDNSVSDEHLAFFFINQRATYLEVLADNPRKELPKEAFQKIKLKMIPTSECDDELVVLRSECKFPAVINNVHDTNGMRSVKLESIMTKWINVIDPVRVPFIKSNRFNSNQIYVSLDKDNHVIMLSTTNSHLLIEEVEIELMASNPEELFSENYNCGLTVIEGENCDFYESKFPMPQPLINTMINEAYSRFVYKSASERDLLNNSTEDNVKQRIPYNGPRRIPTQNQQQFEE